MVMAPVRHRRREASVDVAVSNTSINNVIDEVGRAAETAAFVCAEVLERQPLDIAYRPVAALMPSPGNARTHSTKQLTKLAAAIKQFGFTAPILIDERLQVLAGHGRLAAAKLLGMTTVPTIQLSHMSEAQKRAYMIADNKLAELAGWDEEVLALEFQDLLQVEGFDIELTGFDTGEIDLILEDGDEAAEGEADVTPASGPAVTCSGDLWVMGDHRLLCGDAREKASFERLLGGEPAQMVFTDAPYNVEVAAVSGRGQVQHREFAMASGEMSAAEFTTFLKSGFAHLAAFSADGSIHYLCMDWRHIGELTAAAEAVYAELKNVYVWDKGNGGMGSFYRSQHELVFVYKRGTAAHINNFGLGERGRFRTNLWSYPGLNTPKRGRAAELAMHPTVKPVALVADAIRDCSKRRGIVLDAFGGSGSTLIAAEKTGR